MVDPEVRKILKAVFHRCPKYCSNFVKTKFLSYELLESGLLKPYLNCPSKLDNSTKKTYLTVETVIK